MNSNFSIQTSLSRRLAAETLGSALLLATVVGSGIMGERLSSGIVGLALLANTLATGAALVTLIVTFAPISGAHFNPCVTLGEFFLKRIRTRDALGYVVAQFFGAFWGVLLAHVMFGEAMVSISTHVRSGISLALSECVATFGLLSVIWSCSHFQPKVVPFVVGAYITAAYWFTASTSFANPAVTLARAFTNTFSGIRPVDVPLFIFSQLLGLGAATIIWVWMIPELKNTKNND